MAKKKNTLETFKLVTEKGFPFAAKEAYNALRTNLQYALSPTNGKIVFFKSSELAHEVLLSNQPRMSITGWLKS